MKRLLWCLLGALPAQALTLNEAIQIAGEQDPAFQAQLARTNADQEAVAQVRSRLFPQVSFEASRELQERRLPSNNIPGQPTFNDVGNSDGWNRTDSNILTIEQVLFDSVLYAEIREARAGTQVTLAQLEQSRLDLVQGIIEDYIATLKQAETVSLLDQEIASVRQSLKLAWSRFLDGTVRETEALRAEGQVLSVVNQREGALSEFQSQLDLLAQKLGKSADSLMGMDPQTAVLPGFEVDEQQARAASPDLLVPRRQQEAAEASLSARRNGYYPTIDLSYTSERADGLNRGPNYDAGVTGLPSNPSIDATREVRRDNTATITFSWDLYTGGNRTSRVREAEANVVAAEFDVEASERQFRFDLASAQRRARLLETTQKSLKVALEAFEKVAIEQRAAYQAGLIDIATVLQAESDLAASRAEFVIAKYDAILAQTELRRLSGGLDEAFFQQIDDLFSRKITVDEVLASR